MTRDHIKQSKADLPPVEWCRDGDMIQDTKEEMNQNDAVSDECIISNRVRLC